MPSSSLMITVPPEKHEGGIEITMYTPKESAMETKIQKEGKFTRCVSIRTVFVGIFLFTVVCIAVSLTITNHQGQLELVEKDTEYRMFQLNEIMVHFIDYYFEWIIYSMNSQETLFYHLSITPNGTDMLNAWPNIAEYMWSKAREQVDGAVIEYNFPDGRIFGIQISRGVYSVYEFDYQVDNGTGILLTSWLADTSIPIMDTNFSDVYGATYIPPPYPALDYLASCDSPIYWEGVYGALSINISFNHSDAIDTLGDIIGYLYLGVNIDSYYNLLLELSQQNSDAKFFVIDTDLNIVASSSDTPSYDLINVDSLFNVQRMNVTTTNEQWIKDIVKAMKGNYNDQAHIVTINETRYYLSVYNWNKYDNIDWIMVSLVDYTFLLGATPATIRRSVVISIVIGAASVVVAFFVTYFTTKPLFKLASNMQKIATLDLDGVEDLDNPHLVEVKRLYHSYLGMNAALRSFKKFVPTQVVSKIIRSKKEVAAELKFRIITIMFQDIAGFTTLSESMHPTDLAKLTSECITKNLDMDVMTTIICKHGGTIDKYIGVENHPTQATAAAVECIQALAEKNKEWVKKYGVEMNFRTGIHTGEVLIGNMGSDNRMNYTAFGDNVNISARLEGVNKLFGTRIIVSKEVYINFPKDKFITRKLGKVRVSGKSIATTIYEVVGVVTLSKIELIQQYSRALTSAKANKLEDALVHLEAALTCDPKDKASIHLQNRIKEGIESSCWSYVEDLVKY